MRGRCRVFVFVVFVFVVVGIVRVWRGCTVMMRRVDVDVDMFALAVDIYAHLEHSN